VFVAVTPDRSIMSPVTSCRILRIAGSML
jgi:hypothetical protein